MATTVASQQRYPAAPEAVLAMLLDPAFARERAERTGALAVEATVREDGAARIVRIVRTLPAEVPDVARSLVGDTLEVTEEQSWGPLDRGIAAGSFHVGFSGPVRMEGTMRIEPDGEGTLVTSAGEITAKVPFVGGRIEAMVREQVQRYLDREESIGRDWLAR